jgi:hypothetical protein
MGETYGDLYLLGHRLAPFFLYTWNDWTLTQLRLSAAYEDYPPPEGLEDMAGYDYADRTGLKLNPGVAQYFSVWGGRAIFGIGYNFIMDMAAGNDWESTAHLGEATVLITPLDDLQIRLWGQGGVRLFSNPLENPFTFDQGEPQPERTDTLIMASASLKFLILGENLFAGLGYTFILNKSTVELYDYNRHLATVNIGGGY